MESDCYRTEHPGRGLAIVICNENFQPETGRGRRPGAEKDLELLTTTLKSLGFIVREFKDLTSVQMIKEAKKAAREDHTDYDCIVLAISSHGSHDEVPSKQNYGMENIDFRDDVDMLYGTETAFEVERLTEAFSETNCPSLKGKPKLFFFQGCRGEEFAETVTISVSTALPPTNGPSDGLLSSLDGTVTRTKIYPTTSGTVEKDRLIPNDINTNSELLTQHDNPEFNHVPLDDVTLVPREKIVSKKVIIARDYLTMWSCPPGYFAFHTNDGSPFITILCEVLIAHCKEDDLLTMLTEVNRRVATEYESQTKEEYSNNRHIVPSIEHMLRKRVYLR